MIRLLQSSLAGLSLTLLILSSLGFRNHTIPRLSIVKKINTRVAEPSDFIFTNDEQGYYMVSDQGYLFQTDLQGRVLRQAAHAGVDFESLCMDAQWIYVCDERTRRVLAYDKQDLHFHHQVEVPCGGASNEGYEGFTYNSKQHCFLLGKEKNPVMLVEFNTDLHKGKEIPLPGISDLSSLTYFHDHLYVLSDEDQQVFKLDPETYSVLESWKIPITNPEGICFDAQGHLFILSDKDQQLYQVSLTQ